MSGRVATAAIGWTRQRERGSVGAMRLMARLGFTLGWRVPYALLYPVVLYFLASSPRQRQAAGHYLNRALGRPARFGDLFRLYLAFAATILDRVFLLSGRSDGYQVGIEGLEAVQEHVARGRGVLLMGAHFGSFEPLRWLADHGCPVEVRALMFEDNAAQASAVFSALCPRRAAATIPLGRPDTMLRVKECLDRGGLVGLLADRAPRGEKVVEVPFLGAPAALPIGPHLLASVLGAPVVLAFGIWTGPRRYILRFERFEPPAAVLPADQPPNPRAERAASLAAATAHYADRLALLCREHPYNWFNFHDFWGEMEP